MQQANGRSTTNKARSKTGLRFMYEQGGQNNNNMCCTGCNRGHAGRAPLLPHGAVGVNGLTPGFLGQQGAEALPPVAPPALTPKRKPFLAFLGVQNGYAFRVRAGGDLAG